MSGSWLKWARTGIAALFFGGLVLAFVDFRHAFPDRIASVLAAVQLTPATVAATTGTGFAMAALVLILVSTLLAGRVYCSAICPLGILQDVIARVRSLLSRRKRSLRYTSAHTRTRLFILGATLVTIPLGGAGLAVAWLDPYSHFGRIFSLLVRPVVVALNNVAVPFAEKWSAAGLYRGEIALAPMPLVAGVALFFAVLVGLVLWRGRIYCNTICPVGTMLGFIAKHSYLKLQIRAEACGRCAECLRSCKAQCIDLKERTVDMSRCVGCFNCLAACHQGAMELKPDPAWLHRGASKSEEGFDAGRRRFLLTTAGGVLVTGAATVSAFAKHDDDDHRAGEHGAKKGERESERKYREVITPPLAGDTETFLARCTACQLCVSACPTGVLQPSLFQYGAFDLLKPRMDYDRAFCNYTCHRCTEVCPTDALPFLPLAEKQITRIGMAHFKKNHCIVHLEHTDCGACSEHCPTKAVNMVPYENGLMIPEVEKELCIGCGACEFACPAEKKAITVHGAPKSKLARRPSDEPATRPTSKDGFPF